MEEARKAIDRVFSDRSVSAPTTLELMEELRDYVQSNIDALREEVRD